MPLFVDPDIAVAQTLPVDFYLTDDYFRQSREKIFARTWQFIGDTDQVKDPGWVTPVNLLEPFIDERLVLAKDKQGEIHCLSNVCTHRGNLVVEKPCQVNDLRCKYHGRRFGLNGKYLSMPEFKEVRNFPTEADNLHVLPIFKFGKWLFTSLNPAQPAEVFFKDMIDRVSWMPFDQFMFRPDLSKEYIVEANWALYCENYLEGFHIPFVHAGLNSVIDYSSYTVEPYRFSSLQIGIAREGELAFDLPPGSVDHGKRVASYYFWIFPNMMFNFYPWGLSLNVINPITPSRTKVKFLSYVWDESKLRQGAGADLHKVELEDEEIVQNVQKGIRSRFYKFGRYSVTREVGTHHFHRLIADFMR
ncbi:MAG TPA: aromatic ring-hydroxylating dioxygenase subunit alpha [Cyclobacteriaceae bacterium]|nr:aromatic ring-hydroxylating dioxygenase subunit alpha [Cyclobacteriaceae bacterium]